MNKLMPVAADRVDPIIIERFDVISNMVHFVFILLTSLFFLMSFPADSQPTQDAKSTEFVGVGIALAEDKEHNRLIVNACVDGTAAKASDIQKGDVLLKVDGFPATASEFEAVVARIRGPVGTSVALTFERNGTKRTITLPRVRLSIPVGTGDCESKEKP